MLEPLAIMKVVWAFVVDEAPLQWAFGSIIQWLFMVEALG